MQETEEAKVTIAKQMEANPVPVFAALLCLSSLLPPSSLFPSLLFFSLSIEMVLYSKCTLSDEPVGRGDCSSRSDSMNQQINGSHAVNQSVKHIVDCSDICCISFGKAEGNRNMI